MKARKIFLIVFTAGLFLFLLINSKIAFGQEASSSATLDLQNRINELQAKVSQLAGEVKTLSSQIAVLDSQIKLTELRIESNKQQISDLVLDIDTTSKKISTLQNSLDNFTGVLLNRIVATYEVGSIQPFQILLSSNNATNFFSRLNYLKIAQEHDRKLIFETTQAKNDYANQRSILEDKKKKIETLKKQLEDYNTQLAQQKQSKKALLSETQGSEENYQRLLNQARAQLAAFSSFTAARGGASILSNQTVCDDWGCYYNQRDSQWGNTALNHTQFTIASDGCLVTSMAMVYTHYSHRGVTPLSINSDPNNFASYYPAFLRYTITADGATSSRVGSVIDGELNAGRPVIVGVGRGPDHFVVITKIQDGRYVMNDPFVPNGHNVFFTDHYSVSSISEVDKVVF